MKRLEKYMTEIVELCKQYKVKTLYAFGSILTRRFNKNSDVDLIVDFQNIPVETYFDNYIDFKFSLENVFKREVDLLEEKGIRNPFFRNIIEKKKVLVYGN